MMSLIVEAVLISFCIGGAVGAVLTMHLQHNSKTAVVQTQCKPRTQRSTE